MDQFDLEPLRPTDGVRTAASDTERILIGLALVALLGGAVVGVGNLLQVDFEALASASPQASGEATSTPRPTAEPRARRQFVVEPGPAPLHGPDERWREEWIRARVDLTLYNAPSFESTVRGLLRAGEAAFVSTSTTYNVPDDGNGWALVSTPVSGAWAATTEGGEELVTWYPSEETTSPGWVSTVVSGPDRFLAVARAFGESPRSGLIASSDGGSSWSWVGEALATYGDVQSVAWGPAGWLAITLPGGYRGVGNDALWLHRSADGIAWEPLGELPAFVGGWSVRMVASGFGYLLLSSDSGYTQAWYSSDGIAWREMGDLPRGFSSDTMITGLDDGFIALSQGDRIGTAPAAFSVDGRDWVALESGPAQAAPDWQAPMMVQLGDRVIAIESDPQTHAARVWLGTIQHGQLTWRRAPGVDATFRGATLDGLVSDGTRAWVFGWQRGTVTPVAWSGDGVSWSAVDLPYRVVRPEHFTAGPSGVVLVGSRPSMRGGDPIFWHLTADGGWLPEPSPIFEVVPDRPADCGQLPRDLVELQARSTVSLVACFGATPVTMRGWTSCSDWNLECAEDPVTEDPQYRPGWLATPKGWLALSPVESGEYIVLQTVFDPARELGSLLAWEHRWVEVTMHLDDPAALTCVYRPAADEWWYVDPRAMVDGCRQTWVVDAIREVDGP